MRLGLLIEHPIGGRVVALSIVLFIFSLPVVGLLWMTSVPGHSYAERLPALSPVQIVMAESLERHIREIASEPHNVVAFDALDRSAERIEASLVSSGYTVRHQQFVASGRRVRNIEVVLEPASPDARTLVIGAHYDSFGNAPGANDNGTGVAAVLELAKGLADLRGKSALRIRFVLFTNEEPPFFKTAQMGSLVYARRLRRSKEDVLGMISLETMGYFSDVKGSQRYPLPLSLLYPDTGDFIAFVGLTSSRHFVRSTVRTFRQLARFPSEGGTAPGSIAGIDWSDHWSFAKVGIPALMVTDTAPFRYPFYHSSGDTPDRVDYRRLARVTSGLEAVIRAWAVPGRLD